MAPNRTFLHLAAGLVLAASCTAHAQEAREQAVHAAVADGVSTALGIAAGAAELNPIGPVLTFGMKAVVLRYAEGLPDVEQPAVYAAASSLWSGAAANNVCIAASIATGGAFAPACIALGIAWGLKTWRDSEDERLFWEGCAMLRLYAEQPELPCIYTPLERRLAAAAEVEAAAAAAAPLPSPVVEVATP